jgi:hypothetical protein
MIRRFHLLTALACALLCAAAFASSEPPAIPGTGGERAQSPLYSLLRQKPAPDELFWARDAFVKPVPVQDQEELRTLYLDRAQLPPPDKVFTVPPFQTESFRRSGTLLTFMLRRAFDAPRTYAVPVVIVPDLGGERERAWDQRYQGGKCQGMGTLEADLKGLCPLNRESYGLIEEHLAPQQLLNFGLYHGFNYALPRNGSRADPAALLYRAMPALLGLHSEFLSDTGGAFTAFDRMLFSEKLGRAPEEGDTLLDAGCGADGTGCALEFRGPSLSLFKKSQGADYKLEASRDEYGKVRFKLPRTLLSGDSYVNHGFYTEPELLALRDLGYDIRPREFVGATVAVSGYPGLLRLTEVTSGFSGYSEDTGSYDIKRASEVPLSTGTEILGSFNRVVQRATIASTGTGAVGIRSDGTGNVIELPRGAAVIENGRDGTGILLSYGSHNVVRVDGTVSASGEGGTGILADFGSNVLSDMQEYRGSYLRVRPYDYLDGKTSLKKSQAAPLPQELSGPMADLIAISGTVKASAAAVRLGPLSHVKEIRLEDGAWLEGGIVSEWRPYFRDEALWCPGRAEDQAIPARLQLEGVRRLPRQRQAQVLHERLHTKITAGSGDEGKAAAVTVRGGIRGQSLDLNIDGARVRAGGGVQVHELSVQNGVLSLDRDYEGSQADELTLGERGVLNLVDGAGSTFTVEQNASLSPRSAVRVDVSSDGAIRDFVEFSSSVRALGGSINVEPGLPFADIRSFNASPREFMRFMETFMHSARAMFRRYGLNVNFPKHVWYESGTLGMEVRCSARGCRAGRFTSAVNLADQPPLWRYAASAAGCLLLIVFTLLWFQARRSRGLISKPQP